MNIERNIHAGAGYRQRCSLNLAIMDSFEIPSQVPELSVAIACNVCLQETTLSQTHVSLLPSRAPWNFVHRKALGWAKLTMLDWTLRRPQYYDVEISVTLRGQRCTAQSLGSLFELYISLASKNDHRYSVVLYRTYRSPRMNTSLVPWLSKSRRSWRPLFHSFRLLHIEFPRDQSVRSVHRRWPADRPYIFLRVGLSYGRCQQLPSISSILSNILKVF